MSTLVYVVMGVSGCGKSTLGKALGAALGDIPFSDGDTFHPQTNVSKMKSGVPLTDADRAPWLAAIADHINSCIVAGQGAVVACSALKAAYRETLKGIHKKRVIFCHLVVDEATLTSRLAQRQGHFFHPSLLASQFAALESPPTEGEDIALVRLEGERSVEDIVSTIIESTKQHVQLLKKQES